MSGEAPRSPTPLVGRAGTRREPGLQSASCRTPACWCELLMWVDLQSFLRRGWPQGGTAWKGRLGSRQERALAHWAAPSAAVSERPRPQGPGAGHLGSQPAGAMGVMPGGGAGGPLADATSPRFSQLPRWMARPPAPCPAPEVGCPLLLWLVFLLPPSSAWLFLPQPSTQGLRTVGGLRGGGGGWGLEMATLGGTTHPRSLVGGRVSSGAQVPVPPLSSATHPPPPPQSNSPARPRTALLAAFLATWQPHCRTSRLAPPAGPAAEGVSGRHASPLAIPGPLGTSATPCHPQLIHAHTLPRICSFT